MDPLIQLCQFSLLLCLAALAFADSRSDRVVLKYVNEKEGICKKEKP